MLGKREGLMRFYVDFVCFFLKIIETFEKVQNARLAKIPLTKKEKEKAMKLIREREILSGQLKCKTGK